MGTVTRLDPLPARARALMVELERLKEDVAARHDRIAAEPARLARLALEDLADTLDTLGP